MSQYVDVAAAQADGVVHHWAFDENTGATFADAIDGLNGELFIDAGNNADLTIVDSPLYKGRDVTIFDDDTAENMVGMFALMSNYSYSGATEFTTWTIRTRFYFRSIAYPAKGTVLLNFGSSSNLVEFYLSADRVACYTANAYVEGATTLTANAWHEVVATYDGTTLTLYLNNSVEGTHAAAGSIRPYDAARMFFAGKHYSNASFDWQFYLDGVQDEVTLWNRALTAPEVATLYNSGTALSILPLPEPPPPPPLTVRNVEPPAGVVRYSAVLTGAPDATTDLNLSISSFNARLRSASQSSVSLVVPDAGDVVDAINARPNGEIVLYQTVQGTSSELARFNFDQIREDIGARSGVVVTLSGTKQVTYEPAYNNQVSKVNYSSRTNGAPRLRLPLIADIQPQDEITYAGSTFTAELINYISANNLVYMEVSGVG